jgi:cytochrome b561
MQSTNSTRYGAVAMTFHWVIALAILTNITLGYLMDDPAQLGQMQRFALFQFHKSIGLTILVLSLLRLGWRLIHKAPPLSPHLSTLERVSAHAVHWLFYGLMIGVPFLGWAAVSVAPIGIPTLWFTLFRVPHLPYLGTLPRAQKLPLADIFNTVHTFLAYSFLMLLALHVAGALKHQFWDRDNELGRMVPGMKPPAE